MKKFLALLLVLCLALPVVALAEDSVTLRFSWWGGDERHAATIAVIEQYEAAHPNVTIEPEYGSSDGYNDKLATQLSGGTAPDIIQIDIDMFHAPLFRIIIDTQIFHLNSPSSRRLTASVYSFGAIM